jgi:hypothetical protein
MLFRHCQQAAVMNFIGGTAPAIDTRVSDETIQILTLGTAEEKQSAIREIRAHPENYAPPVFYTLSNVLFTSGEKDEGSFWFYAGQLRAAVDASICADASASQAIAELNQKFGTSIKEHTFKDPPKLADLITSVIEWDRNTPYNYDRRWINLRGMDAMMPGLGAGPDNASLSRPEDQWDHIAEKTRDVYWNSFIGTLQRGAMKQIEHLSRKGAHSAIRLRTKSTKVMGPQICISARSSLRLRCRRSNISTNRLKVSARSAQEIL